MSTNGALSNYAASKLMDLLFGKASFAQPSLYLALLTATAADESTGSTIVEPSGGAYARLSMSGSNWNTASGGEIDNSSTLVFDDATADWGTIVGFAICDASSGGHVLIYGELDTPRDIEEGDTAQFSSGSFLIGFGSTAKITDTYRNIFLNHLMGKTALSVPGIYIGLVTTTPTRTSTGATIVEPSGSYARLVTSDTDWSSSSDGATHNSSALLMTAASASWSSGSNMAAVVLVTSSTTGAGALIFWGVPGVLKSFLAGDTPWFAGGDLEFILQ